MSTVEESKPSNDPFLSRYGLTCDEAYVVALALHRREKDYLEVSYTEKNNLSAFYKQATYGPYQEEKAPSSGWLDFVGNDRRKAWQQLGNLSQAAAKAGFCQLILSASGKSFESALTKAKREKFSKLERERAAQREAERKRREEEEAAKNKPSTVTLLSHHDDAVKEEQEQREAVYQRQQEVLERQHRATEVDVAGKSSDAASKPAVASTPATPANGVQSAGQTTPSNTVTDTTAKSSADQGRGSQQAPPASPAALWTRPGVKDFTETSGCSNVNVGRSDSFCIRVPVEKMGESVFWQFSTVDYDISFSVHFFEGDVSADESQSVPLEKGTVLLESRRVNSHQEVVCGSHKPTSTGYYLLRFDNTYSYLRSKTVFFHVYCAP